MKKILLCQHGGSGNHGCEALARTVISLIAKIPVQTQVTLYSYQKGDDLRYMADVPGLKITGLDGLPGRFSYANLSYHVKRRLNRPASKLPITAEFKRLVEESNLVIAIGGDNYCYNKGEGYFALDEYIKSMGKRYMLLGCSIEPADLPEGLGEHLQLFDRITARETITYQALLDNGVSRATLVPDPAFLLPKIEKPLPQGFAAGNTVGINLSPLIMKNERRQGITDANYEALIRDIIDNTDMQIALIPHVVWPDNDDRSVLRDLYQRFADTGRVVLLEDDDGRVLKGYIARLRFFIGARTHATIAAYSTGVPTLVVGYSVKALGIARDLLGTEKNFVLPVQNLAHSDDLAKAFRWIRERETEIRDRLAEIMPDYSIRAEQTADAIEQTLSLRIAKPKEGEGA